MIASPRKSPPRNGPLRHAALPFIRIRRARAAAPGRPSLRHTRSARTFLSLGTSRTSRPVDDRPVVRPTARAGDRGAPRRKTGWRRRAAAAAAAAAATSTTPTTRKLQAYRVMTLHHQRKPNYKPRHCQLALAPPSARRHRRHRRRRRRRRRFGFYGLRVAARWAVLVICEQIEPRERRRCVVVQNRCGRWLIRRRTSERRLGLARFYRATSYRARARARVSILPMSISSLHRCNNSTPPRYGLFYSRQRFGRR